MGATQTGRVTLNFRPQRRTALNFRPKIMQLDIITPDRKVFSGEASSVTFPGTEGQFQVLNDHAPLVSTLARGPVTVATATGQQTFTVDGGVVEVLRNKVLVLAEAVLAA